MSREINDLFKPLKRVLVKATSLMQFREKVFIIITCTKRLSEEQEVLWYQGRTTLGRINKKRKEIGLPPITKAENRIITKAKVSYHSTLPKSMAFDFCISEWDKKIPIWNPKVDINENDIPDYEEFANICKKLHSNIEWGGDWKWKDYGHIQWKNGLYLNQEKYMKGLPPRVIKPKPMRKLGRGLRPLIDFFETVGLGVIEITRIINSIIRGIRR